MHDITIMVKLLCMCLARVHNYCSLVAILYVDMNSIQASNTVMYRVTALITVLMFTMGYVV